VKHIEDEEFEAALKKMSCPECGKIGHLTTQQMQFKLTYKGHPLEAEGEGWVCLGGCNRKFISDELTEQFVNQTRAIDGGGCYKFIEVDRKTGAMKSYPIH
jgi:hypothetical protein